MTSRLLRFAFILSLSTLVGCSIATSVSSPFESSSTSVSSSSGSNRSAYRREVTDYTSGYVRSSSDLERFKRGLGRIAASHGISNWESDQTTYLGIGAGLRKGKVTGAQYEAYKEGFSQGDHEKAENIQRGYDEEK